MKHLKKIIPLLIAALILMTFALTACSRSKRKPPVDSSTAVTTTHPHETQPNELPEIVV